MSKKHPRKTRKNVWIAGKHHRELKSRAERDGRRLEAVIDMTIEHGLKANVPIVP